MNKSIFLVWQNGRISVQRTKPSMDRCMGIKVDGHRCTRAPRMVRAPDAPHLHFCAIHWRTYDRNVEVAQMRNPFQNPNHVEGTCLMFLRRRWCGNPAVEGTHQCRPHLDMILEGEQRIQARHAHNQLVHDETQAYRDRNPPMTWRQVVDDLFQRDLPRETRFDIGRRYFFHPGLEEEALEGEHPRRFLRYWEWRLNGGQGAPPNLDDLDDRQRRTGLAAIAHDSQNVHTTPVSEQTNRGIETLLAIRRQHTGTLRSPDWFAAKWLVRSYGSWQVVSRVVNDMVTWYNQPSCRSPNDHLYRNLLDGLYLMIRALRDDETKIEAYRRAFEECFESVGMCCDGHITRVCNVLVGFDDAFTPPVPIGDLIQSKMAAIAGMDIPTDEKIALATAFFTEHNIQEADRTAWLDAF